MDISKRFFASIHSCKLLLAALLLGAIFAFNSCSDDTNREDFSFDKTIQEPVMEKRCVAGESTTDKDCYLLHWRNPSTIENLVAIHVWIDTTWMGSTETSVDDDAKKNSIKLTLSKTLLIDSLDLSDTLATFKDRDTIQISIWAEYSSSGVPGRVMHTFVILGDDIPPGRVQLIDSTGYNQLAFRWTRPIDQTDFYKQDILNGKIVGYNFVLKALTSVDLQKAAKSITVTKGGKAQAILLSQQYFVEEGKITLIPATSLKNELHFAIPDSFGFMADSLLDRFTVVIGSLTAETQFEVGIDAMDSAGNMSNSERTIIATTDAIAPLVGNKIGYNRDPLDTSKALIDSNRIYFYWPISVDPLINNHNIVIDSALKIPGGCVDKVCYKAVSHYVVEQKVGSGWQSIRVGTADEKTIERTTSTKVNGKFVASKTGLFVGDTLKWIVPGMDSVCVRVRAVDSSGAVSKWLEKCITIGGSELANRITCPAGFLPVKKRAGADTSDYAVFCMERFEHSKAGVIEHNTLFSDARKECQALSGNGLKVDLCNQDDWFSACSERSSTYGTLQEAPFYAHDYLLGHCNLASGDSTRALDLKLRDPKCVSAAGIRDLPANIQEWVLGDDGKGGILPRLKGSSYKSYVVSDVTVLAKCGAVSTPIRWRPRLVRDSVYLYKNGVVFDTLLAKDTTRQLYRIVTPAQFVDTVYWYKVEHPTTAESLGIDFVDAREYKRRTTTDSLAFINAIAGPLKYRFLNKERLLILSGQDSLARSTWFYTEPAVGYRCCATPE